MTTPVLSVRNLLHRFPAANGAVHAVNDVSFDIAAGETLGLVGESGSGKSTIGLLVTRLLSPTAGASGDRALARRRLPLRGGGGVTTPVLSVRNLVHRFPAANGSVHAVNDVSFDIAAGETLGLVGESGSGKSTIGLLVTRLLSPTAGTILFEGADITRTAPAALRPLRARLQIVFQDPWGALNPRMTIARLLEEPLLLHAKLDGAARRAEARRLADRVRLPDAALSRYPHELSGGQLQRVSIARAIANRPKLVVLDEPTSSLDLSVRAGILQLLDELQRETGIAMLFISHDLETVRLVSHRVIVLYLGRIAEEAPAARLFARPAHPYTQTLLSAHLPPDPSVALARHEVVGEIPSPVNLPPGCFFAGRCPVALPACEAGAPAMQPVEPGHGAACIRVADGTNLLAQPEALS